MCGSLCVYLCPCVYESLSVCVPPWTKGLSPQLVPLYTGRGVWHSRPTTRNEAVGESGKQGPINPAYLLQLLNTLSNLLV